MRIYVKKSKPENVASLYKTIIYHISSVKKPIRNSPDHCSMAAKILGNRTTGRPFFSELHHGFFDQ